MSKARSTRFFGAAAWILALVLSPASPALAQESPAQFDAANRENRRHSAAEDALRSQAHDLRNDQAKALLQCQGAGSVGSQGACANNVGIGMRQRGLRLDNQAVLEDNTHNQILKGIGVHRVP